MGHRVGDARDDHHAADQTSRVRVALRKGSSPAVNVRTVNRGPGLMISRRTTTNMMPIDTRDHGMSFRSDPSAGTLGTATFTNRPTEGRMMMGLAQSGGLAIELGDMATWAGSGIALLAAVLSVACTAITIWWPWRNRPQTQWMPVNETDTNLWPDPKLSGFKGFFKDADGVRINPQRILRMYNTGDGAAYGVIVDDENAVVIEPGADGVPGSRAAVDYIPCVRPGEFFFVALLSATSDGMDSLTLHWLAAPTNRDRMYVQEIPVTESDFGRAPSPTLLCKEQTKEWKRNRPAPHRYVVPTE